MNYQELIDLGFVREDYSDPVYTRQTGHTPFHLTYDLMNGLSMYWDEDNQDVRLIRCDSEGNILKRMVLRTIVEVEDWIEMLS